MTVGTCGLEQYPLGVSLSGVETNESGKTSSGLPTIVHVVSWIESTGEQALKCLSCRQKERLQKFSPLGWQRGLKDGARGNPEAMAHPSRKRWP
jgi:hypothetical protein